MTRDQVGHIPNINVCFNDSDDQGESAFGMDTYIYKTLCQDGTLQFDVEAEIYKHRVLDDYKVPQEETV